MAFCRVCCCNETFLRAMTLNILHQRGIIGVYGLPAAKASTGTGQTEEAHVTLQSSFASHWCLAGWNPEMFLRDQSEHEVITAATLLPKFRMTSTTQVSIFKAAKDHNVAKRSQLHYKNLESQQHWVILWDITWNPLAFSHTHTDGWYMLPCSLYTDFWLISNLAMELNCYDF